MPGRICKTRQPGCQTAQLTFVTRFPCAACPTMAPCSRYNCISLPHSSLRLSGQPLTLAADGRVELPGQRRWPSNAFGQVMGA
jgi:hypothetical protein